MSDHDTAPDPVDKTYAQAEVMLDDQAARAARRARVLGAVAGEAGTAPIVAARPKRRVSWAAGGWLAAASVAGLSVLVALQFTAPPVRQRPPSPVEAPVAAAPAPAVSPATATAVETAPPAAPAPAPRAPVRPPADIAVAAPSAFPAPASQAAGAPMAAPAPPPPPAAAQAQRDSVEALIVTGQAVPPSMARAEAARAPTAQTSAAASLVDRTARLHAAAAAGRLAELTSLLAQGTPVDAPDGDGETALMKAIQANRPAAAALLLRHSANLDRTNRAGVSARDMAASVDDAELNRALGLELRN